MAKDSMKAGLSGTNNTKNASNINTRRRQFRRS